MNIEIYKPIRKYDKIEVRTWHVKGKAANFPRGYEVLKDGEVYAQAMSNWALVNINSKKLVRYKDYDMSKYSMDDELIIGIKNRFCIPKELDMQKVEKIKVRLSDVDLNGHMNNTKYLRLIYNSIPDMTENYITSINLRYMKEAPMGSEMEIFRSKAREPEGIDSRAEKIYYFYTLVDGQHNLEAEIGIKKYERCIK
jgi:acyl-ACP thioesterase